VADACEGDEALRQEFESLLAVDGAAAAFLERPAAEGLAGEPRATDLVGQTWGAYTIVAPLGAGGMGEVYQAHDARLDRDVALKVLRSEVSADPERRARLAREAKSLAALGHPNIGAIFGLEERDGAVALILELVEGPTLAERLEDGPLPAPEALAVARQIAEALQAAHDKGFVHRDLKPANIVLQTSPEGTPHAKVLDFGLAKPLAGDASPRAALSDTTEGRILGTPAYMSPEQARGLAVDRRTDIWAFGCVLFEMLSGLQPFEGATVTDTLARILDREPDWSALPQTTPDSVRRLLERCLRKEPHRRLHDIGDALIELEDGSTGSGGRRTIWKVAGLALSAAAVAGVLVPAAFLTRASTSAGPSIEFDVPVPEDAVFSGTSPQFAISPDGRYMAFSASSNSVNRIWVRPIASAEAHLVPGMEGGFNPFWRPDGTMIAFFAVGTLRTVPLEGGSPVVLAQTDGFLFPVAGAWNDRDDMGSRVVARRQVHCFHLGGAPVHPSVERYARASAARRNSAVRRNRDQPGARLVGRWPPHHLHEGELCDCPRPLDDRPGRRSQAPGVPEDPILRGRRGLLAGWSVGCVPFQRDGSCGDLREALSAGPGRLSGQREPRNPPALEGARDLLPLRRRDDGRGRGHPPGPDRGSPRPLFPLPLLRRGDFHPFAVTRDGRRFLLPIVRDPPLTVVSNWKARLHR
jgi:Protein kinase domain/WD40-like Beta Propeller Repeat